MGRGGGAFTGTGGAQKQGGEILHPGPEVIFIEKVVVGKDVVPEFYSEFLHTLTLSDQAGFDQVIKGFETAVVPIKEKEIFEQGLIVGLKLIDAGQAVFIKCREVFLDLN